MKTVQLFFSFFLLLMSGQFRVSAQDFSNKGKDFWITYPAHIDGSASEMGIYITSDQNATGTITVGTVTLPFTLTANSVIRKFIGQASGSDAPNTFVYLSQDDGIKTGAAIHVVSDNPVAVYSHIINTSRSGSTLVLPSNVWGKDYIIPSYKNQGTQNSYGAITVVAAEANTDVKITPSVNSKNGLKVSNVSYTITLANPGDVYQLQFANSADISGTRVQSVSSGGATGCKRIGVFSSTTWSAFGCGGNPSSGDNLYQQLFPTSAWGKNFLTAPAKTRNSDIIRVFVSDPAAVVRKTENGLTTTLSGLVNNTYYEFATGNATFIQSDKSASVMQYFTTQACQAGATIGDPEMILINPVEQTINNITVFSAHKNWVPPGQSAISNCFLNIIIKSNSTSSFKINGNTPSGSFVTIPGTSYSYLQEDVTTISLSNPIQNLKADSSFIAIAYGFGAVESYGYNAGTNVKDFTQVAAFQNPYKRVDSAVTCANTPFQFSIPLNFQPTSAIWDFSAAPNISPAATVGPVTSPVYDSVNTSTGSYYYSTGQTYMFARANTSALRDTIKLYTTSSSPDGCGSTSQTYSIPVKVNNIPVTTLSVTTSGCITDAVHLADQNSTSSGTMVRWLWDFGDATTLDTKQDTVTSKRYAAAGNYTIKLKAINDVGCASDEVSQNIVITAKPVAAFTFPQVTCLSSTITFTDASTTSSGTITKWTWNLDNGQGDYALSSNASQTNTYTTTGDKHVTLQVETNTGCKSDVYTPVTTLTVHPVPVVGFVIPEVCLADAFAVFTDTTTIADHSQSQFTYLWNFNAGSPAITPGPTVTAGNTTSAQPHVRYNKADNYAVSVQVTSKDGCAASLTQQFTVNGSNPFPSFTVNNEQQLCSNQPVQLVNTSTVDFGNVTRLEIYWDYTGAPSVKDVDETPSINKVYSHQYLSFSTPVTKSYTIRLVAYSGGTACQAGIMKVITLNASPVVSFTTMPGICNEASARQITQATGNYTFTGSFAYSGTGVSAAGLFDPQVGVGTYPIRYIYTTSQGCADTATQRITVWPSPVAAWSVSNSLCEKNAIIFTDNSVANYSHIVLWKWVYGDGNTDNKTSRDPFTHTYTSVNSYTASLQVTTDSGCTSTPVSQVIKINPLPVVGFSLPAICLPDGRGQFNDQSSITDGSEGLFLYRWDFGDTNDVSVSTLKNPYHTYTALGPYSIKLKITTKDGCTDSLTRSLTTVYPQPKANFTATPAEACIGDSIHFTDKGNGMTSSAASWSWNIASNISGLQNPVQQFIDSGSFQVSYHFVNGQGCVSDTAMQQVVIDPYPKLVLEHNAYVLEGGTLTIIPKFVYGTQLSYKWTPDLFLNTDTAATPKSTPKNDITYKLTLTGKGQCTVTDTTLITVLLGVAVPNVFSPNGDGINDTWHIRYLSSYPDAIVDVYDRYGQVVFHSVGYPSEWDGTYNGHPLSLGTYYYVINPKNGRQILSGSVTIIK